MKKIILIFITTISLQAQSIDTLQINETINYWHFEYSNQFKKRAYLSEKKNDSTPWEGTFVSQKEMDDFIAKITINGSIEETSFFETKGLVLQSTFKKDKNQTTKELKNLNSISFFELIPINNNQQEIQVKSNNDRSINILPKTSKEAKKYCLSKRDSCFKLSSGFYNITVSDFISKKGVVQLNLTSLNNVFYKKVSKQDIGNVITFNRFNFKVIDIINNKIIIHSLSDKPSTHKTKLLKDAEKLNMINLDDDKNKIASLSHDQFYKIKDEQKLEDAKWSSYGQSTINSYNYSIFKNNPYISLEEYKKLVNPKILKIITSSNKERTYKEEFGDSYTIFYSPNKIENAYFYAFKYLKKEFELQFNKP